jgi:hypothetical protein
MMMRRIGVTVKCKGIFLDHGTEWYYLAMLHFNRPPNEVYSVVMDPRSLRRYVAISPHVFIQINTQYFYPPERRENGGMLKYMGLMKRKQKREGRKKEEKSQIVC